MWLHVLAGREAARREEGADSVIASDVIAALGTARTGTHERVWRPGGRLADPVAGAAAGPRGRADARVASDGEVAGG